jgi:hypothetical protein
LEKKFEYERQWRQGKIRFQADTLDEVEQTVKRLDRTGSVDPPTPVENDRQTLGFPSLRGGLTCADAIRSLLADPTWAREPRTETEIGAALKANAYHYSRGTVSGLLIQMLHKNELRRPTKKNNAWAYVIDRVQPQETRELLVTA